MPMKPRCFKCDDAFWEYLDYYAKKLNISKAELIRRSVNFYITYLKNKRLIE